MSLLDNPRMNTAHPALDSWPQTVRGRMIEPSTGIVRIRRPRQRPLELSPASARLLASHVEDGQHGEVLAAAADEADRQLGELMHGPIMTGAVKPPPRREVDELMQGIPGFACS